MNRISNCPNCSSPRYKCYRACKHCLEPVEVQVKCDTKKQKTPKKNLPICYLRKIADKWLCTKCNQEKPISDFPKKGYTCRSCINIKAKEHRDKNPSLYKKLAAERKKSVRKAKPKWLSKEQEEQIRKIYAKAQVKTAVEGIEYHVDHIVPLRGKNVCGLHVPWNLRVIEAKENLSKNNKLDGGW